AGPAGGAGATVADPRHAGAHDRRGLFRHVGGVGPEGGELRDVVARRRAGVRGVEPPRALVRLDGVQHLPGAVAGGDGGADVAPDPVSGVCLWAVARDRRAVAEAARGTGERLRMNVTVLLFAAARDHAGADAVTVELPAGATVAALRLELVRRVPTLATLLRR